MEKNENKKSLIDINIDSNMNQNEYKNDSQIVVIPMVYIPKEQYDKLCLEYNKYKIENEKLKDKLLNIADKDLVNLYDENKELKIKIQTLTDNNLNLNKTNEKLLEDIRQLKLENNELKQLIKNHENTIKSQNDRISILEDYVNNQKKENLERLQKCVSAELCIEYENYILNDIFGITKYKLYQLLNDEIKLTPEQTTKWNKYYEELKLHNLLYINEYMKLLTKDRNELSHEPYKPSNFTKDELKNYIYSYIKSFPDGKDVEDKYIYVVDYMMTKVKFKSNVQSMRIQKRN